MTTTVNLEKVLSKQRKKVITPAELLAVEQFDRLSDDSVLTILKRSGFINTFLPGQNLKNKLQKIAEANAAFPIDKVYHISQIKQLCDKYRLKFLQASYYKGSVPVDLGMILVQHEIDYKFKLNPETTFIMAPPTSFNLQSRLKDPLVFHKINDEHYFLMHKWGNDLSVFRSLIKYLQPVFLFPILGTLITGALLISVKISNTPEDLGSVIGSAAGTLFLAIIAIIEHDLFIYDSPMED